MNQPRRGGISRRQFARRAAVLSATASIVPAAGVFAIPSSANHAQAPPEPQPNLSAESQAEAEARLQLIFAQYAGRFTDEEKKSLQHLNLVTQESIDRVRSYPLENGDSPSLYLKPLVERPKKKVETPAASPAKKS
jgi:hypothetical protein